MKKKLRPFESDQEVRWCPGCGDYAVLATLQRLMPKLGYEKENVAFISGIGCASRFPYYMDTYGFHTIHGRAPAVATGLKLANPDLLTWVVTGDGDSLSIGLSHLVHLMRRNVNVNILMLNNQIYGLTKGQYSPTSNFGKVTKTSPFGTVDKPLTALSMAIAADCSFVARAIDVDAKNLSTILEKAVQHQGTSFIEIVQNCNVFNDGAFSHFTDKSVRPDKTIYLEDKAPLVFGAEKDKSLHFSDFSINVKEKQPNEEIPLHDTQKPNKTYATALAEMTYPDHPIALGILRAIERPTYETLMLRQKNQSKSQLENVLKGHQPWLVKD